MKLRLPIILVLVGVSLSASAQGAPDAAMTAKGRAFALLVCAVCHVVSTDQEVPPILRNPGPRFDAIANRPGTTAESLRAFLTTKHATMGPSDRMPNPQLADYQIDEVISYILSLRTRP